MDDALRVHLCMGCRGVRLPATQLVTSSMLAKLRNSVETRSEFLRLCGTT
jgi:GTP cyclohydrolase I